MSIIVTLLSSNMNVDNFLKKINLYKYKEAFVSKGYDKEVDCLYLSAEDIDEIGVSDETDRQIILKESRVYELSEENRVGNWLKESYLDEYKASFFNNELYSLEDIQGLVVDENLYEDLGVYLPGHRKRLQRAVNSLQKRHRASEVPVAYGYWGKPSSLDAQYDFLCVAADINSTKNRQKAIRNMEFLIDTGSDVVTVREELLEQLDLERLSKIDSRGVHVTVKKQLYRAELKIGKAEALEVEVIGGSHDSIGIQVMKKFKHFVDHEKHTWLKGEPSGESCSAAEPFSGAQASTSFN